MNEPDECQRQTQSPQFSDASRINSPSQIVFSKVSAWYRSKSPVLMFVVALLSLLALYYIATLTPFFQQRVFPACLRLNASLSNALLNCLGQNTKVIDASIFSKRFSVDVRRGCDAIEPTVLFLSAVLAFPAPLRRKVVGAMVGSFLLLTLNLARIATLFLIGVYYPRAFHTMHADVWQIAFILLAVVCWVSWIAWSTPLLPRASNGVN
jgi:exosortase/archaeosortase family protein